MDWSYATTPFLAWFVAGVLKFAINSLRAGKLAFGLIGYGGLPSNHSAIVSSMSSLIAMREGMAHPAFGLSLTLTFIVILDAHSLRRAVGKHAAAINRMAGQDQAHAPLRERMGHSALEIAAGLAVGIFVAAVVQASPLVLG